MYILETEQSFDSAHFLSGYKGKCSNLHGHRWRVVARIAMDELNKEGQTRDMVIDFGDFKDALKKLTDALDHSFIFLICALLSNKRMFVYYHIVFLQKGQ